MAGNAESPTKRKENHPGSGLDYLGIGVEIGKRCDKGLSTAQWEEIAAMCGSASGSSVRSNWNKFKRAYEVVPMNADAQAWRGKKSKASEDAILKPNSTKVSKTTQKTGAKRGRPKKVTQVKVEDSVDEASDVNEEVEASTLEEDIAEDKESPASETDMLWGHELDG